MAKSAASAALRVPSDVRVSPADTGGWIITVERDGEAPVTEHHTDWHRVERRLAALEAPACPWRREGVP